MIHKIEIIHEKKLMLQYFAEKVSMEDLLTALQAIVDEPGYNPTYNGLTLMDDAEVGLSAVSIKNFSAIFENVVKHPGLGKLALLVDKPSHTALSQVFQYELDQVQEIQIFNTLKGACAFLEIDYDEVILLLDRLKK